jgi:hypothetical protein
MFKKTKEQEHIVQAAKEGKNLSIKAAAGSSKTTTCVLVADAVIKKALYIAFNNSIAKEAETKFPAYVLCKTIHSIAWKVIIKYSGSAMGKKLNNFFDFNDVQLLQPIPFKRQTDVKLHIMQVIKLFCQSGDMDLTDFMYVNDLHKCEVDVDTFNVLEECKLFWQACIDEKNPTKITHDVYLKMYQLTKPRLDFQMIYLDEAQDSNGVTLDIVLSQTKYNTQIIVVGDEYQSIYEWRGAINAFDSIPKDFTELYLTESFRFTQDIADMATKLTNIAGNDRHIKGNASLQPCKSKAVIVRNNSTLLSYLLAAEEEDKKVYCLADLKQLWGKLYHIQSLYFKNQPRFPDSDLKQYANYAELLSAAEKLPEISKLVKLTVQLSVGSGLTANINKIKSVLLKEEDRDKADFVLTTCHKAKGLEYDEVTLADDLLPLVGDEDEEEVYNKLMENQTLNLLYVAVTRGKYKVNLPPTVQMVINNFETFMEYVG